MVSLKKSRREKPSHSTIMSWSFKSQGFREIHKEVQLSGRSPGARTFRVIQLLSSAGSWPWDSTAAPAESFSLQVTQPWVSISWGTVWLWIQGCTLASSSLCRWENWGCCHLMLSSFSRSSFSTISLALSGTWYVIRMHSGVCFIILQMDSSAKLGNASFFCTSWDCCPFVVISEE